MANIIVKIPEKHYVALQARKGSECPVGFLVPWGTDKAAQKRMASADSWASRNYYSTRIKTKLEAKTINNELMNGFKLATNALRGGRSSVWWRIVDPRGFELEISSENMARIIRLTTIENGEILSSCVWARQGASNILLPEESEEYKDALKNTERVKISVSIRDVNVGDKVLLQNGEEVVYLGKLFTLFQSYEDENGERIQFADKKRHYFYAERIDSKFCGGPAIKSISSPKISKITEQSFMEIKDAAAFINNKVQAFEAQIVTLRNDYDYRFIGVTNTLLDHSNLTVELEEIINAKATSEKVKDTADNNEIYLHTILFIAKLSGNTLVKICYGSYHYKINGKDFGGTVVYTDRLLDEARLVPKTVKIPANSSYDGRSYFSPVREEFDAEDAEWFWPKIVISDPKTNEVTKLRMI